MEGVGGRGGKACGQEGGLGVGDERRGHGEVGGGVGGRGGRAGGGGEGEDG